MSDITTILDERKKFQLENNLLYNFLEPSATATFYDDFYSDEVKKNAPPEFLDAVKEHYHQLGEDAKRMEAIISNLESRFATKGIVVEIGGSRYQNRSANAYSRFRNYFPLDISHSSIQAYTQTYNKIGFVSNAQQLPFKDNSIDCIFTHTFLEHPLEPEKVLNEIIRVLKVGGIVVHNDAWFCRWWQRYGVVKLKKFSNMTFQEKLISLSAWFTELKVVRIPPILMTRLAAELFAPKNKVTKLRYKKLTPNYSLHLGCDEDAASGIDPLQVIRYYESRGFQLNKPLSSTQRLFHPNNSICLEKIA